MTLLQGDCVAILPTLLADWFDACVTDPPYALTAMSKRWAKTATGDRQPGAPPYSRHSTGFMGKAWDSPLIVFDPATWSEVLRVLKPGAHLVAFGGTRTYHRLVCAIEDAGFEIRDTLTWLYGSGFPKSLDVSKAIDTAAGAERERDEYTGANHKTQVFGKAMGGGLTLARGAAVTEAAQRGDGWGTALKPACELIVLARKPLSERTVAANVLRWGTGGLNIAGSRIGTEGGCAGAGAGAVVFGDGLNGTFAKPVAGLGRWPANLLLDEEAALLLDEQSGERPSGYAHVLRRGGTTGRGMGYASSAAGNVLDATYGDSRGASRFFYTAKADGAERHVNQARRNAHPTVKPLALMAWLVRLVTAPGGHVLDPFLGSGTTAIACIGNGFEWTGIEKEAEYVAIAEQRIGLRY